MPLPIVPLPEGSVVIQGETVAFHALSRAQAMEIQSYKDREDEAEDFILACGTGITVEEAHAWREATGLEPAGVLIDAILILSGLTQAADPKASTKQKAAQHG